VKRIPKNLLVVGGGVIGLEFATVFARMGAKVLVVEMLSQLLTGTDLEIAKTMQRILKKQGIEIALSTKVESLEKKSGSVKATISGEYTNGKPETREYDTVLVAVGRRPVTAELNLPAAGLATDERGFLAVDAQRRTKVAHIYAIGDVTGAPLLAHKAMREGVVAAEAIGGDRSAAYDPVAVPNCVYTDPEVATVGLSEEEAKAAGYELRIGKFPLIASGRARTMNESDGLIKLVGDAKSDLLLGMHIVAPQAESLIGEGVIALEMGATLEDIGLSIHPHPTLTESIMDAAEAAHGKAIHLVNPKPKPAPAKVAS
jgi:dihydrolipoamide dehydrogenase